MTKDRWIFNLERRANEHLLRADIAHSEGNFKLQLEERKKAEECFDLRDAITDSNSQQETVK